MLNIILFGPPGAGKGTQAKLIAKDYNLTHLSTGEILRQAIRKKDKWGLEAKKYIDKGELVPDQIIIDLIEWELRHMKNDNGFIFDGFPRTKGQAEAFDKMLEKIHSHISAVIRLIVTDDVIIERLYKRAQVEGRTDDTPEIIQNRIKIYREKTEPILKYYQSTGKLFEVDGLGTVEEVYGRIKKIIETIK